MPRASLRHFVFLVTVIAGASAGAHASQAAATDATVLVRFAVIGDSGTGQKPHCEVAAAMAAIRSRLPFELVLMPGDNLYGGWSRKAAVERFERVAPQHGITYFVCGSPGQLRRGNLAREPDLTAASFDQDQTFIVIEAAAETLHFQTISRTGAVVDSGHIDWTARVSRRNGSVQDGLSQRSGISFLDLNHHEIGHVP